MSDIADISTNSDFSPPLYTSTVNSKNGDVAHILTPQTEKSVYQHRIMNNMKTDTENNNFINEKNNHNLINMDYMEKLDYKTKNDNKPLKLKVVITNSDQNRVMNVLNDLSKPQSPIVEKNSIDFIATEKGEGNHIKRRTNKPIMGRSALLKKANIEANDSMIIYDLITEKYNGVINHYLDRSSQRRRLRTESSDFSDTVYSSLPAYSPWSVSSIGTPGSPGRVVDEMTGFRFPIPGYPAVRTSGRIDVVLEQTEGERFLNDEGPDRGHLRFITSTDNSNKETTVEDMDTSGNLTGATEKSNSSFSDYDPNKFLDNAIGELTSLSLAYGVPHKGAGDKNVSDQHQESDSIGSSNLSALISKAGSLCISAASKINTKKNMPVIPAQLAEIFENKRLSLNSDVYLETLMKGLSLQNEIMFQVSKALSYCRTMKKFESSTELLEAERILLIASCTKEAITQEIQNVDDDTYEKHDDSKCCGEVTLSNLTFYPKDVPKTEGHREFTEHFVVIFTCGSVVLASEIVTADEKGAVHINRRFNFPNLAPDFEISVCIYAMRVGHKQHLHQDQKINCPSPKKIFFHLKKCSKKSKVLNDVVYIKPSSFTLWGKCEIRSRDISKTKNNSIATFNMTKTPLTSSLSGAFSVKINTNVKLTNKTNGFLTIGTDNEHGCTIWNRRWCVLDGSNLKYWNYPSEEMSSPLGTINMCNCLEQRVHLADRSICARPRTLMLPIKQKEIEKKYFIAADNCSSLEEWEKDINDVVCSLRLWNSMST